MKHGGEVYGAWLQVPQGGGADGPKNVFRSWGRSHLKPTHGAAIHSDQHKKQADDKLNDKRDDKQRHTEETSSMTSWMTR